MRILGIDYGDRRIGFSLSDPLGIIAGPLPFFEKKSDTDVIAFIKKIVEEKEVNKIIIGLPINMDGTEGPRAVLTREFGEKLKELNLEIIYKDERLSSVTANRVLDEAEVNWRKRKGVVDTIAAVIILQSYLDKMKQG